MLIYGNAALIIIIVSLLLLKSKKLLYAQLARMIKDWVKNDILSINQRSPHLPSFAKASEGQATGRYRLTKSNFPTTKAKEDIKENLKF